MTKKRYTIEEIDVLIRQYKVSEKKETQAEVLKELLDAFEGFIVKYVQFLQKGVIRKKDKDIISLVSMFQSSSDTDPIEVIRMILVNYTHDDILSQLQLIFIQCVNKYTKQENGPAFTGFLYAYYKFMIRNWLRKLSKDALNTREVQDVNNYDYLLTRDFAEQIKIFDHICMTDHGDLTNLEKYILYLYYYQHKKDREIGRIVGLSRVQINIVKNKALDVIKEKGYSLEDFGIH